MIKLMSKVAFCLTLTALSSQVFADNKKDLSGKRLIMEDAYCAGIEFNNDASFAVWRAEMECQIEDAPYSDDWRVKWLDDDIFVLVEVNRINETSPPRTMIYKILSLSDSKTHLLDYWTGWGDVNNETIEFTFK